MEDKIRVACVQMAIVNEEDREVNLDNAIEMLKKAGERKPDLVCLPELFTGLKSVGIIPGRETERVGDIAKYYCMYVIAPFYVKIDRKVYNCSVLLDRKGQVAGYYRKVHLWPWEAPVFGVAAGDEFLVFKTDFGVIGLCICHDHQFPETARSMALQGAEIICCSTRMPDPFQFPWLELSRVRALENQVFVISAGASFNECSTHIISPKFRGAVLSCAGPGVHIIDAELDLGWLREQRQDSPLYKYPSEVPSAEAEARLKETESYCYLQDRRPETYFWLTKK